MSAYGYDRDTTPNLEALAKQGVLFTNTHANATWTLPSHVSLFTGLYPFVHGVNHYIGDKLDSSAPFLPEILHNSGYTTTFFLRANDETFPISGVYDRGIDTIVSDGYDTPGYFQKALDTVSSAGKKSFVFFHTYRCHDPYLIKDTEPLLYASKRVIPSLPITHKDLIASQTFTKDLYQYLLTQIPIGLADGDFSAHKEQIQAIIQRLRTASTFTQAKQIYEDAQNQHWWGEESTMQAYINNYIYWDNIDWNDISHRTYMTALYDQAMHGMDEDILGVLRNRLKDPSFAKRTIVVVTSDHGEEFMEHGQFLHNTLYDFNTQVPLVFFIPGVRPRTVSEHVQSVDIAPTILDTIGVYQFPHMNGTSLIAPIRGLSLGTHMMIANGNTYREKDRSTVRENDWVLFIKTEADGTVVPYELYNTHDDPNELTNILMQNVQRVNDMIKRYTLIKTASKDLNTWVK